jgi:hypothetical protein
LSGTGETRSSAGPFLLRRCRHARAARRYLPGAAEVNTAVAVLETYGPAVTEALRQLDQATTVAWKAMSLVEVTDEEWQLVKRGEVCVA